MPGPSSSTTSSTRCPGLPNGDGDRLRGVPGGVVDEVPHHLAERGPVAPHPRRLRLPRCRRTSPDRPTRRASASARSSRSTSWWARATTPSSARVSSSSCSTSRCMRADSSSTASASSPSGSAPGCARATSAVWRMLASGDRSSWEASATNCCCRSRESSSRPSIWFIVRASRWISSRERGLGHPPVQPVAGDLLDLAPDAFDRRERPGRHDPGRAADEQEDQRQPDQQRGDQRGRRVLDLLERDGDGDDVLLVARLGVLGRHDVAVVGAGEPHLVGVLGGQRPQPSGCEERTTVAVGVGHLPDKRPRARRRPRRPQPARARAGPRSRSGRPGPRPVARRWSPARRAGNRGPGRPGRRPRRAARSPPRARPTTVVRSRTEARPERRSATVAPPAGSRRPRSVWIAARPNGRSILLRRCRT